MCCEEKDPHSLSKCKTGICLRLGDQRRPHWGSSSKAEVKRYGSQTDEGLGCMFISQDRLSDAAIISSNS